MIYVDRNSEENHNLSKISDVRIAWGGSEAVKSIANFSKKYTTEDLIFGPKLSLSVIGKESMVNEIKVNRIARNIAIDSSIFDQKACASSHNVFIEKGGLINTKIFLNYSFSNGRNFKKIPLDDFDFNNFDAIKSARLMGYTKKVFSKIIVPLI